MFTENNPEIILLNGKYKYKHSKKNISKQLELKIKKLGIPPAYENLWVSKSSSSDIQAICLDAKGRKQYFYHTNWINKQTNKKYIRMYKFMKKLNSFWNTINKNKNDSDSKIKIMSYMFKIIKITHIRIGNKKYLDSNESIGLTTLKKNNVSFKNSDTIILKFKGKSNVEHKLNIKNKEIFDFIRSIYKTPNEWLMQYKNPTGIYYRITSTDMNKYLQSIMGKDFTCKDFRTHAANKLFIKNIQKLDIKKNTKTELKKNISTALELTAKELGHNKSTSKNSYVNEKLIEEYNNFPLKIKKGNPEKILLKVYKNF